MNNYSGNVVELRPSQDVNHGSSASQTKISFLKESEYTGRAEKKDKGYYQLQELIKKLQEVYEEAKIENWDGEGAEPISDAALYNATGLLAELPYDLMPLDIIPDNDGYIEFEWSKGKRNFSIYVTDTNLLLYAGYFGDNDRLSGRFYYNGSMPKHIKILAKEALR